MTINKQRSVLTIKIPIKLLLSTYNWIKNLFHRHTLIPTKRTVVGHTEIEFSNGGCSPDFRPATIYLVEGYCLSCKKQLVEQQTVLEIFDKEQPYDVKDN